MPRCNVVCPVRLDSSDVTWWLTSRELATRWRDEEMFLSLSLSLSFSLSLSLLDSLIIDITCFIGLNRWNRRVACSSWMQPRTVSQCCQTRYSRVSYSRVSRMILKYLERWDQVCTQDFRLRKCSRCFDAFSCIVCTVLMWELARLYAIDVDSLISCEMKSRGRFFYRLYSRRACPRSWKTISTDELNNWIVNWIDKKSKNHLSSCL